MFDDTDTTMHLLGYLTEEQWLDAFDSYSVDKGCLKDYAKAIAKHYHFDWSEKLQKHLY